MICNGSCTCRHVFGLVVYAGSETRIQKNAARPPMKIGSFDRFLNIQIFGLISVQVGACCYDVPVALPDWLAGVFMWEQGLTRRSAHTCAF